VAKKSMIARDNKRENLFTRFFVVRSQLKQQAKSQAISLEDRQNAVVKLRRLPRNSSPVRLQRRCQQCGRPKSVYRKFGLCRICLRTALMSGQVPGGRKASW